MSAGSLLYVDDDTVASVVGAPHGALVLAKDDCENCVANGKPRLAGLS